MKKLAVLIIAASVAGSAVADLAIAFKNSTGFLKPGYPSGAPTAQSVLDAGTYVQLVWSATAPVYQTDDLELDLLNPGEFLLAAGVADQSWGRFDLGVPVLTDALVGTDINSGYFYARIFDATVPVAGSFFVEMGIQNPTLKEYDPLTASTIYSDSLNDLGNWQSLDVQGTTVIPEPATFGMMGVAALGLFLARKKARR